VEPEKILYDLKRAGEFESLEFLPGSAHYLPEMGDEALIERLGNICQTQRCQILGHDITCDKLGGIEQLDPQALPIAKDGFIIRGVHSEAGASGPVAHSIAGILLQ